MQPGSRLHAVASSGLVGVGVVHLVGHFAGRPSDAAALSAFATMDGYRLAFPLGMTPSLLDLLRSLSLTMSALLVSLGALNIVAMAHGDASRRLRRRLAGATALGVAAVIGLQAFYRVLPPLALLGLVETLLAAAWIRLGRTRTA